MTIKDLKSLEFSTDSSTVECVRKSIPFLKTAIRKGWSVKLNSEKWSDNLRLGLDVKNKVAEFQFGYVMFDENSVRSEYRLYALKKIISEFCKTNDFAKFKLQFLRQESKGWQGTCNTKRVW